MVTKTKFLQTLFYKHNGEYFKILFQMGDFSLTQGFGFVFRRLELLDEAEEESSPCPALRQLELGFQPLNLSQNPWKLKEKRVYLWLDWRQRLHQADDFPSRIQRHPESRSDTWHPLVSISCAPTLEGTSSLVSIVPSWLGVTGTRATWLFKKSCLWDNNKIQAARRNSCEFIVFSWARSFTVRVTESGPKSRNHSIPLLDTEKLMLLYCRLEVYKMRMEMSFWLTVWTNGESTRICYKWEDFYHFGSRSGVPESD